MTASSYSRLAGEVLHRLPSYNWHELWPVCRSLSVTHRSRCGRAGLPAWLPLGWRYCPKPEQSPLNSGAGARMLCITAREGSRYKIYIGGRLPSALEFRRGPQLFERSPRLPASFGPGA